ncbi:MAG: glycosyl hydrolase family 8 [Pseudomonadota bacterium]|nr:glycosyl hydrolase family 8 [Pseudomonadota bacterium]
MQQHKLLNARPPAATPALGTCFSGANAQPGGAFKFRNPLNQAKLPTLVVLASAVLSLSTAWTDISLASAGSDWQQRTSTTTKKKRVRAGDAVAPVVAPAPIVTPGVVAPAPVATTPSADVAAPEVAGIAYPFGSHKTPYVAGIRPNGVSQETQDALIRTRYQAWKSGVSARCGGNVVNFNASYAAVSEGMGYGMMITVLMAGHDPEARNLFDGLLRVVRSHPAYNSDAALMEWRVNSDCSGAGDGWNAMDGDLDIAMALLMADKQWGSSGSVNYKAEGIKTITAIKAINMHADGRTKGLPNGENNRTSDYMTGHFKAFKRATGDAFWDSASDKAFALLNTVQANYASNTGLVPDFIVNTGSNPAPSPGYIGDGNDKEGYYWWNACRLPWRLATDYVTSGDYRAQTVLTKMVNFFESSTGGNPAGIMSGYKLDGTALANYANPSFVGPATAGAMVDAKFQPFLNNLWSFSSTNPGYGYYDNELQLLSLVVASGNWWNP